MSDVNNDVLVFNTDIQTAYNAPKEIKTFDLIDPSWPIMYKQLDDFDFANPPQDPNEFASSLVETCKKQNGLGLSANQCGYPYRVFVMGAGDEFIACFNPKVISSEGEAHMPEMCLSFPLLQLRITRPKSIQVEYQDWTGKTHQASFDGLSARIFLHELDHMNGMVYTDKAKPLALKSGLKKVEKFYRKYFNPQMMKRLIDGNQKANS
jgi:peptide deformylase